MSDQIAAYLEAGAALERVTTRCDGLIVDVRGQHEALQRWRTGVEDGDPARVEAVLTELLAGEPPGWATIRHELRQWIAAAQQVHRQWSTLSSEQRAQVMEPPIQFTDDGELLDS